MANNSNKTTYIIIGVVVLAAAIPVVIGIVIFLAGFLVYAGNAK
jgi:hypothetical protein